MYNKLWERCPGLSLEGLLPLHDNSSSTSFSFCHGTGGFWITVYIYELSKELRTFVTEYSGACSTVLRILCTVIFSL